MTEIFWKATEKEVQECFGKMTAQEAESFFNYYRQLCRERLAILNRMFFETGGGNEDDLDFSPDSLVAIWHWAMTRIHHRDFTANELARITDLPNWFREDQLAKKPLSEDSLILINDIAYYFGEVLVRNLEGVNWRICKTKVKRYVDQNQPVLGGFPAPFEMGINPRDIVKGAGRSKLAGKADQDVLLQCYDKYAALLEGNASN